MSNYEDLSIGEIKDLLRQWRENNERRSEDVMEFWSTIMDNIGKLGNEKYVILEQVFYAALDTHTYSVSKLCISLLNEEFPDSMRVERHKTAQLDAEDNYEDALVTLSLMIKADETNAPARKRRIALKKGLGLIPEAIKELVDYLKIFMSDVEAWQELCSLYLQVQEYGRAAFCAEELILHQPHNHLMHQRLADIRYTMGGIDNMELAKTYYCQALKLNPDNMRALLGLFLVTNNLLNHYKSSGNSAKRAEAWKLCQYAQSQTVKKQKEAQGTPASPPLSNMMLALAITD